MKYALIGFVFSSVFTVVSQIVYYRSGHFKWFYHDVLKWHQPDTSIPAKWDGCNYHAICKHCGKRIIMDSQGNWF